MAAKLGLELFFNIDTKNDETVDPFINFLEKDFKGNLTFALDKSNLSPGAKKLVVTYINEGADAYFQQSNSARLDLGRTFKGFLASADLGVLDKSNLASFDGERTQQVKDHFAKWNIVVSSSPGQKEVLSFLRQAIFSTQKGRVTFAESNDFTCIQIPGTLRHAIPGEFKNAPGVKTIKRLVPDVVKNTIVTPSWLTTRFQEMGFSVHIWTINNPETEHMNTFMKNGCLVITDFPQMANAVRATIAPP